MKGQGRADETCGSESGEPANIRECECEQTNDLTPKRTRYTRDHKQCTLMPCNSETEEKRVRGEGDCEMLRNCGGQMQQNHTHTYTQPPRTEHRDGDGGDGEVGRERCDTLEDGRTRGEYIRKH